MIIGVHKVSTFIIITKIVNASFFFYQHDYSKLQLVRIITVITYVEVKIFIILVIFKEVSILDQILYSFRHDVPLANATMHMKAPLIIIASFFLVLHACFYFPVVESLYQKFRRDPRQNVSVSWSNQRV
jgi:hypothetical protein